MARQTFADFLARGLPFGDVVDRPFVYDALRDTDFPDVESWDEVESYMRRRDPDTAPETLKAVQLLWQLYVRDARVTNGPKDALRATDEQLQLPASW